MHVMTYNIRYGSANDRENAWPHRREDLLTRVSEANADLIGVQEAEHSQIKELKALLPFHQVVGKGRNDGKTKGEYSGLFVDTRVWSVGETGMFWLSPTPEKIASTGWGNNVNRVCTWAKLQRKSDGFETTVSCTHWDHESQNSREKSAELICQRLDADQPLMLMGDFNASLNNKAMTVLEEAGLRDSWRMFYPEASEVGSFNNFSQEKLPVYKIDGIWVSRHFGVERAWIDDRPGGNSFPSDHFPVHAVLRPKG